MKKLIVVLAVLLLVQMAVAYETTQGPTEALYWDANKAYEGYTLFGAKGRTYLIDMEGQVVHSWNGIGTNPRFLDNGNILDASTDDPSRGAGFIELDWDGTTIWEYEETRDDYEPHHDFVRIFNPKLNAYTTLYIANKDVSHDEAIANGCDPANGSYDGSQMDALVEVDMSGNIVWEWRFIDHLVQDIDPAASNYVGAGNAISDFPGKMDANLPGRPVKADWLHCNSLDYNQELDQIVVNSVQGEFYVIDHGSTFVSNNPTASIALAATDAGDFLYRFGDPARYEQGDPPSFKDDWTTTTTGHKQIGGAHDVQWINPGLPGAGNFLIFNNGQYLYETTPQSYIVEINGFLNASSNNVGSYVNPPDAGYTILEAINRDTQKEKKNISNQVVWMYWSKSNQNLFSHIGSGAQRLPNGNTLICAMTEGHIIEVTADMEVVWEYINPVTEDGITERFGDQYPVYNGMFRAYRYADTHPALVGKDLTPQETLTGAEPDYVYIAPTNQPPQTNITAALTLPDTGQTQSFTDTFGEDSDYTINPPSYTDNGNGTVSDNVTGLMWQQTDGGEMLFDDADDYCAALILGSHSDWRLPTSYELFTIMNHGQVNPALNTNYFTETNAQYWWTSESRSGDASRAWAANAGGGMGPHPTNETVSAGGAFRYHVLAVCGDTMAAPDLTDHGDGTISDATTGLTWMQAEIPAAMTWVDALVYAETNTLAGHSDWRLPNIKELQSIRETDRENPAIDTTVFTAATAASYWSSSTLVDDTNRAWTVGFQYGIVDYTEKTSTALLRCVRGGFQTLELSEIPAGTFEMGDHAGLGGAEHANDELPIHSVTLSAFSIGKYEITTAQYCEFLNSATVSVSNNLVVGEDGQIYCDTFASDGYSRIGWSNSVFSVLDGKEEHPATGMRWIGTAAYCNWLSDRESYESCYDLATGDCDFSRNGYRLPTEAEWEYAARGGLHDPYAILPWGNDTNSTNRANWPNSGDPFESGDLPYTTPVGYYDGSQQDGYQTQDGSNGYGLHDMAGNVWEWVNDWYDRDYYSNSASFNPEGPAVGTAMPDGNPWHTLRGGNWYNGEEYFGHSRCANRNPGYYRGPLDPDHPYYHIGFRVVLAAGSGVSAPGASLTELANGFSFTEGPAANSNGDVFFADIDESKIYKWSTAGTLSTVRTNAGGANGLFFDADGNLLACEGDNKRLVSLDPANLQGAATVLADIYGGDAFNKPNDLWVGPGGGVYFSDPLFGTGTQTQDGEHVYYLSPSGSVARVIADFTRPNGLIGTPDGTQLYVADHGAGQTWSYSVGADGTLSGKTLFAEVGSDGMTMDENGNVYLTGNSDVLVYDSDGNLVESIAIPQRPTNCTFGGSDRKTLFITAGGALYSIEMRVAGAVNETPPSGEVELHINEVMFYNTATIADPADGKYEPWLELYNAGTADADLNGYFISDNQNSPTKSTFAGSLIVSAGGFKLIWGDGETAQGVDHTAFRMRADKDGLYLFDAGTNLIDSVSFSGLTITNDESYARSSDGGGSWLVSTNPSPEAANSGSATNPPPVEKTVGLLYSDGRAGPGYTLFAPKHNTNTLLIDNDGNVVHEWTASTYEPGQSVYLLENGNLLRCCFDKNKVFGGGGDGGRLEEYDWADNLVWSYNLNVETAGEEAMIHHDVEVLPNGNILGIVWEYKSYEQSLAAGRSPDMFDDDEELWPDYIVELERVGTNDINIVWEWHVWDHLIQDYDETKANYGVVADHPERVDINYWAETGSPPRPNWNHMNSIDYNPDLDQIMLSVRGLSEIWVIDHSTTTAEAATESGGRSGKGGSILFRWGNPAAYRAGDGSDQLYFQGHDPQWIEDGYPGAGNVVLYNNGPVRGFSTADEFDYPTPDSNGVYSLNGAGQYMPTNEVWLYNPTDQSLFHSAEISGVNRLANGNTLICSGTKGYFSEVTPDFQMVWEYRNPVTDIGPLEQGSDIPDDDRGHGMNGVFKIHRYPPGYPGLQGKDLTPQGPVELYTGVDTDTDNDLMHDAWETNHFGNLTTATATSDYDLDGVSDQREFEDGIDPELPDTDGDGMIDGDEIAADTNPADATSFLAITGLDISGPEMELSWQGGVLATQMVQFTDDLMGSLWIPVFTNAPPTPKTDRALIETQNENGFFRIKAEQ